MAKMINEYHLFTKKCLNEYLLALLVFLHFLITSERCFVFSPDETNEYACQETDKTENM